ncbi:probable G-protein coupled receptor Mth-like 1 [Euwallacea fornicatus]|uniref:probable G-protein coupled receptor Mth-like 1 n=1 Tax=Euwallacea fornicatus TaxID=995702 RepID=UPI00338F99FC
MKLWKADFVLFMLLGVVNTEIVPVKKYVTIAKCCALDETLTYDRRCLKSFNSSWDLHILYKGQLKQFKEIPPRWAVNESSRPQCTSESMIEDLTSRTVVPLINGDMLSVTFDVRMGPSQFCLDYDYVIFCRPDSKSEEKPLPLVKKCCGKDAIFSDTNSTCILFSDPGYSIDVGASAKLGAGFPKCEEKVEPVVAGKFHKSNLTNDGSLWVNASEVFLPPANFCLEHIFENAGGSSPSIITCRNYILTQSSIESSVKLAIYPIGLAISAIFLAATLAAGSLLPATHHVLHWRCQTNHVACLLVGDVLLCITQIGGARFSYWPCFTIAVAMHFLFLAAFFWLNTMCFNIWWTFRDLRPQSTEKSQERLRLYLYEAYAWGVPFIIVFVGILADLTPSSSDGSFLGPRFALNKCWFAGNNEILGYFFGPMGILLAINLVLFGLTARELTCGLWKRELVKSTTERAALGRVCAKLVVVMGVSWIMDVISWLVGGPDYLWYFTDIINCLQGVFIFIVVGCQPQVLSAVKRWWCVFRNREGGGMGTTNHDHHSSSSHGLPSVGGETLTNNSSITNTTKSIPLETNC